MSEKVISAAAINALKEALVSIYWYKSELRSFLINTLSNSALLTRLNWDEYKRVVISRLVDYLAKDQERYQNDLLRLMSEVMNINDFSHLERLEDGKKKAKEAKQAVEALKKLFSTHQKVVDEQKEIEERRKIAYEALLSKEAVNEKLEELKKSIYKLLDLSTSPQNKGFILEKIIKELFTLFDLDPKASFRITGEQIDGAFTFDNTDYLFEAKWQKDLIGVDDLDSFSGKITRKLDNTLGLYLSINGFSGDAIKAYSSGRKLMILMDGSDLMAVLEGKIDLLQLLLRKRRHASQTGNIYLPVYKIFQDTE